MWLFFLFLDLWYDFISPLKIHIAKNMRIFSPISRQYSAFFHEILLLLIVKSILGHSVFGDLSNSILRIVNLLVFHKKSIFLFVAKTYITLLNHYIIIWELNQIPPKCRGHDQCRPDLKVQIGTPITLCARGSNIAAESANIRRTIKNHVFVWCLWIREGLKSAPGVAKPVVAMVVRLRILLAGERIPCLSLKKGNLKIILNNLKRSLIPGMVVAVSAWRHFLRRENHVFVRFQKKCVKPNCLLKDARSVRALVAILVTTPCPVR